MVGHIASRKEKESLGTGSLGCEETKEKKRGREGWPRFIDSLQILIRRRKSESSSHSTPHGHLLHSNEMFIESFNSHSVHSIHDNKMANFFPNE